MSAVIPYASEPRPDTGVTSTSLGMWLFLASETMLFGSLFSAYALLRTGAVPVMSTPDAFGKWLATDIDRAAKVLKAAGVKPE